MIRNELRAKTRKQLGNLAKKHRIPGWHALCKDDLVTAIAQAIRVRRSAAGKLDGQGGARKPAARTKAGRIRSSDRLRRNGARAGAHRNGVRRKHVNGSSALQNGKRGHSGRRAKAAPRLTACRNARSRILATATGARNNRLPDRLVAEVRDPYWIHVQWLIGPRIMQRAIAALGTEWHESVPVIRVFDATSEDGTHSWVEDIEIHGRVDNWYVPVADPPRSYELHLGYRAPSGAFFLLARSRRVRTPRPGSVADAANELASGGRDKGDAETSGPRDNSLVTPAQPHNGRIPHFYAGANGSPDSFDLQIQTELIVYGSTHPRATLTLLGEPIPLSKDGTFSLRLTLPDGRQVIPAVAVTPDGAQQRTVVLGVERNTRELEPLLLDDTLA
jgi:hypothetical protein